MALLGPREMSDLSLHSGPQRTFATSPPRVRAAPATGARERPGCAAPGRTAPRLPVAPLELGVGVGKSGFRTFQACPRTCRSLGGKLKVPQTDPTASSVLLITRGREGHASYEAPRFHHAPRRRGCVAARGTRAAAGHAGARIPACRFAGAGGDLRGRVPGRLELSRIRRRAEGGDRIPLGGRSCGSASRAGGRSGPPSCERARHTR
jgi:hypothetical protein